MKFRDLVLCFFVYAFAGWTIDVVYAALTEHRFVNKGLLNLPLRPVYAVPTIIAASVVNGDPEAGIAVQLAVSGIFIYVSNRVGAEIGRRFLRLPEETVRLNRWQTVVQLLLQTSYALLAAYLIHPALMLLLSMIADSARGIAALVLLALLALDLFQMSYALRSHPEDAPSTELERRTERLGERLTRRVEQRVLRAYPDRDADGDGVTDEKIFAHGLNCHKAFWIFLITAVLGDVIETIFVFAVSGTLMRRSSLVFGPLSVVWGIGGVVLTIFLYRWKDSDAKIFLGGFFIGGAYEYLCSLFTELFFGVVFWDYSWMPFNIGGRTNLLYMFFWGVLAVVWMKLVYPRLSGFIEHMHFAPAIFATWLLTALLAYDILVTGLVLVRYGTRQMGADAVPFGTIEAWIDQHYPDEKVQALWPNMK